MLCFEQLGTAVESAWAEVGFDELALSAIAASALTEAKLPERVTSDDVIRWLLESPRLPDQKDIKASFGQPPVTVYRGRRFHVQVLHWLDGSTTIHRHGFSGAFQVLSGSSLHSRWSFSVGQRVTSRMMIGDVTMDRAELLRRGDVVPITPDLTHGLFHLDAPSATIVIRTDGEDDSGPQYEYHPPSVAIDPFFTDPVIQRRLQGLLLLIRSGHPDYVALAAELVARSDLHTAFVVLDQAHREGRDAAAIERIMVAATERHGDSVDDLLAAAAEGRRRRAIHELRRKVRDPDRRFFLALLQNMPDRDAIFALVREARPADDPRETVLRWITELSGPSMIGVDMTGDLERILVEALLDGKTSIDLVERLAVVFGADQVHGQASAIAAHAERLKRTLLWPLFVRASGAGAA